MSNKKMTVNQAIKNYNEAKEHYTEAYKKYKELEKIKNYHKEILFKFNDLPEGYEWKYENKNSLIIERVFQYLDIDTIASIASIPGDKLNKSLKEVRESQKEAGLPLLPGKKFFYDTQIVKKDIVELT